MKRMISGLLLAMVVAQAGAYQSSIDNGGYSYIDSDEASFDYNFDDISADPASTSVSLSDDSVKLIPIGFSYRFYDTDYANVYVSSNGYISFTSTSDGCCSGYALPSTTAVSRLGVGIAAWWEDLYPRSGSKVQYLVKGTAPERELIIQFTDVPAYSNSGRNTFQYKLFEGRQVAEVHYKELYGDSGTYSAGIQRDSTTGTQLYLGQGGSSQNNVPGFSLPYAVRYQRSGIGYSYQGGAPIELVEPGIQRTMNIDLRSYITEDAQLTFEYTGVPAVSIDGPSSLFLTAGSSAVLAVELTTSVSAEGFYDIEVRVHSENTDTPDFIIPIRLHTYQLEQVTPSANDLARAPTVSSDGAVAALISKYDLAGTGKSSLVLDAFRYDMLMQQYSQLTSNPVGRSCSNAAVSGNGEVTALICDSNLDVTYPNIAGTYELFVHDNSTGTIKRVPYPLAVQTSDGLLDINFDGTRIIFVSAANPLGYNGDNSLEIFMYDTAAKELTQLTRLNNNNFGNVQLDYNGERFVFTSRGNPFGLNNSGSMQVYAGTTSAGVVRQITPDQARDSDYAALSANGKWIAFASRVSLFGSNNQPNIFLATFKGDIDQQLTNSNSYASAWPQLSADGSRVAFISRASLDSRGLVNSSANYEPYLRDIHRGRTYMLGDVNSSADAQTPALADDGNTLLFSGTGNWEAGKNNLANYQIFSVYGFGNNAVKGYEEVQQPWPVIDTGNEQYLKKETSVGGLSIWLIGVLTVIGGIARRRA